MHSKDTFSDDMANFKMPRILNLISFVQLGYTADHILAQVSLYHPLD